MNIQNWRTALIESEMTDKAKLVGLVLSVYWNNKGKIYPSLTTLENDCSLTKNTIIRAVAELTDNNFVTVTKEHHRKSSFKINTYLLTGVTVAPMNDTVNEPMIDRANEPSIDSVAIAPMNAPELDIKVFKGIKEKDTIVSKKKRISTLIAEKPSGVSDETWKTWVAFRQSHKWSTSQIVVNTLLQDCKENNADIESVLKFWIAYKSGWQGFRFDWLKPEDYKKVGIVAEKEPIQKEMKVVFSDDPDNIGYRNEK